MIKKNISLLLAGIMLLTLTTACNKDSNNVAEKIESKSQNSESQKPITIKYMTFSAGPDHIQDLDAIIAAFEEENPGIKVEPEVLSWDAYFTKLQTLVSAGTAPDTFELNYENFITYANKQVLMPLDTFIESSQFDTSVFNEKALEAFKFKGEQYGLVESFSNVVFYYNKELFDKAGLDYPDASWDWQRELEAAQKLTDVNAGIWGTYSPIQFWEFYKTIEQNGGSILNEDKTEVIINSKENVEALQWMVDKINKYNVTPTLDQMSGQSDGDLFVKGNIAMLRTGIWMFDAFKEAPFEWDIALEPGNTQKAHHFFSNSVVINKETPNKEASWEWIKFLTSSDVAIQTRIDTGWELPAVENEEILKGYLNQKLPASRQVVFDALDTLVVPPVIERWNELTDAVGEELLRAAMGEKTPQQALDDAKVVLEGLLQ